MTFINKVSVGLAGAILTSFFHVNTAQAANLIANGNFEAIDINVPYTTYNSATVPKGFGWSISNDFVYLVNSYWSGISGTTNPDGFDQSLELRPNVLLSQQFATTIGQNYELSFWYAHDPGNETGSAMGHLNITGTDVLFSSTLTHDIPSNLADLKFLKYTAQFTADTEITTLSFQGDSSNKLHGFVIDNVSIIESPATVPEPTSLLSLFVVGSLGGGFLKRERKQKNKGLNLTSLN